MIAIERVLLPHEALVYLLNLAVVVSLACVAGLAVACVCRRCSAPMQHGILVSALALVLASPLLTWLAQRNGIGLVRITLSLPESADARDSAHPLGAPGSTLSGQNSTGVEVPLPGNLQAVSQPAHPQPHTRPGPAFPNTTPIPSEATAFAQASGPGYRGMAYPEATRALERGAGGGSTPVFWWWAGSLAVYVWAAGICVSLARLASGLLVVARLRRSLEAPADARLQDVASEAARMLSLRTSPPVWLSPRSPFPMALGFFRPMIVLPSTATEDMDRGQLTAVILHEVAHLARRDHWFGLAQQAARILFWWNPLVHRINDRIGELREDICDNYVLQAQGDGAGFAKVLVEAAARVTPECRLPSAIGVLKPNLGALGGRVSRLIEKNRNTTARLSPASVVMLVAFGLAGVTGMVLVGGLRVAEARPSAEAETEAAKAVEDVAEARPAAEAETEAAKAVEDVAEVRPSAEAETEAAKVEEDVAERSSAEPIKGGAIDKDALLRSLRASAEARANALLAGSVQVKQTTNTWPSPDPVLSRKRRGTRECIGTLYFDRERVRLNATTRSTRENKETREGIRKHLVMPQWQASPRGDGDSLIVQDRAIPKIVHAAFFFDPRQMGKVYVDDLARLRVKRTVYEAAQCLRLEEVTPRSGGRRVQIVDPQRGYVALREELHGDNSLRGHSEFQETLKTLTVTHYRHDKGAGIWLPTRQDKQIYDNVPIGVDRQPTRFYHRVTELTGYSLKRPPTGTFTIGGLGLSGVSRLHDVRGGGLGKWYHLAPRNLADPSSTLDTEGLPPDLVDSILGIESRTPR